MKAALADLANRETVLVPEAAAIVRRSGDRVRMWIKNNPNIGRRIGGRYEVRVDAIRQILKGTPLNEIQ
jgi:hypothetical protein